MTRTLLDLADLAREYAAGPIEPRFDAERRWFSRLAAEPDHEVWLLTWLPGQETELHDHGGSGGVFLVAEGVLNEEIVVADRDGVVLTGRDYARGSARRFGPRHVHRIRNTGTVPAVSVHVYEPRLTVMNRYDVAGGRLMALGADVEGVSW
ncbi:hypothetical protein Afil01_08070 [Actinorhabdospora filicis]|uniref:Cysteine dioxygenase type I n=1 Tax=Actinorhabdospora filicis TaxID=1785913 RepID=A0A9W6SF28_9ACTN|nr:cysteine dioxygenase family protein [Actinorhabdospora filicis]GLZ76000.1 hypothetical protein Afil01_08070 [Actinorhabdospora filicis]